MAANFFKEIVKNFKKMFFFIFCCIFCFLNSHCIFGYFSNKKKSKLQELRPLEERVISNCEYFFGFLPFSLKIYICFLFSPHFIESSIHTQHHAFYFMQIACLVQQLLAFKDRIIARFRASYYLPLNISNRPKNVLKTILHLWVKRQIKSTIFFSFFSQSFQNFAQRSIVYLSMISL